MKRFFHSQFTLHWLSTLMTKKMKTMKRVMKRKRIVSFSFLLQGSTIGFFWLLQCTLQPICYNDHYVLEELLTSFWNSFHLILKNIGTGSHQTWVRHHFLTPVKCLAVCIHSSVIHITCFSLHGVSNVIHKSDGHEILLKISQNSGRKLQL